MRSACEDTFNFFVKMSFLARSTRNAIAARSLSRQAVTAASVVTPRRLTLQSSSGAIQPITTAAPFSISISRWGSGSTDAELASRLQQELTYENETAGGQTHSESNEPDFLRDFKSTGIWTIKDTPGSDEVSLVREFGNEKISVMFSIGDIDSADPLDEEDPENSESEDDVDAGTSFPVRVAINISKPSGAGALSIDTQAEGAAFEIENVSYYQDASLANELTAEADWKRRGLYIGPQFPTLDEEVQNHFIAFLDERGINEDLALFIPMLAEYKEQKEYVTWLSNVKKFVEA
ncbi:unnamed protein product [Sympodiomycopsis kandeliae]